MKKILVVAALLAMSVASASPTYAAAKVAPAAKAPTLVCVFLPLLPDCMSMWKGKHDMMMHKMTTKMAAPKMAMMAMPKCVKAKAGSAFMYVCK